MSSLTQMYLESQARDLIELADFHLNKAGAMYSSAEGCLDDSRKQFAQSNFNFAINRALDSLGYSVGVFHPDYQRCAKDCGWSWHEKNVS